MDTTFDYFDKFEKEINTKKLTIDEIGLAFFLSPPKWSLKMFALRNAIVKLFGLKTGDKDLTEEQLRNIKELNKGDQIGLFKVFNKSENQLILGEDDKHLDFKIIINKSTNSISLSTGVIFNNRIGKIYFVPVKPFHKLIVPIMLKRMVKMLASS